LDRALGPYRGKQTSELALFRSLYDTLLPGDVVLGDRLFGPYCDIADLRRRQGDVVFRLHAHRRADFRRGRRLGPDDHLVTWHKPTRCPAHLSAEAFASLPDQLTLREVRVRVNQPGFRVRSLVVVTTLTDAAVYTREAIANLFRQRWHAELDLRSLKAVMHMDVLRCLSPDMVRKEIDMHLLAYNLLRSVMGAAAQEHQIPVRELSFKGTQHLFQAFYHMIISADPQTLPALCTALLKAASQHRVGNRPDRYEPRKRKRAAKPYPHMTLPRDQERNLCLKNH
jgi:hypothetical protein